MASCQSAAAQVCANGGCLEPHQTRCCVGAPAPPAAEYFTGEHRDDYQASDVQDYFMYMGMLASEVG